MFEQYHSTRDIILAIKLKGKAAMRERILGDDFLRRGARCS